MTVTFAQADRILSANFGGATLVNFSPLYLGLSKTALNRSGGNITEPTIGTGGYARVAIDNTPTGSSWYIPTANLGVVANAIEISFPESTLEWASSASPITHIFLTSSQTSLDSSYVLYYAALSSPRAIPAQTTLYFNVGALTISLT